MKIAFLAAVLVSTGAAAITPIAAPNPAYVAGTSLLAITAPNFTNITSLTSGGITVTFGSSNARTVGSGWATWGSAPDTEGNAPRVAYTNGARSITFVANQKLGIFGAEIEGNPFDTRSFTAEYFLGGVSQGLFTRSISGNAGARLLAASGAFDKVTISSDVDFAFGQVRAAAAVPEPQSWALLIAGFGLVGAAARRRRDRAVAA